MTKWFLKRCEASRQGKKSAIIDFSSALAIGERGNQPSVVTYGACKSFNRWFSNGIHHEYRRHCRNKAEGAVDLDVMTVTPSHVKTNMNPGYQLGAITASELTKSIVDQLGYEQETMGS